jgi:hypothetical protein
VRLELLACAAVDLMRVIGDQNIRVIDLQGELIRELTLDPSRNYQPLTRA